MTGTAYQMFKNTDMDEGRGDEVAIPGLFLYERTALSAAVGRGVYGAPAVVKSIPLFETVDEFKLWEKHGDPEYQLYLQLHARYGGKP